ncbi:uncharacterized protein LOC144128962 isoform X2 [Amblyomma americanum]
MKPKVRKAPESPKKALSAWERRRLYSNQLREKTLLQTPSAGPSRSKESGTSARTSPGKRKSLPESVPQNKQLKLAHPATAADSTQCTSASTKSQNILEQKPEGSPPLGTKQKSKGSGKPTPSSTSVAPVPSTSKAASKLTVVKDQPPVAGTTAKAKRRSSVFAKPQHVAKGTKASASAKSQQLSVPQKQSPRARGPPVRTEVQVARRSLGRKSAVQTQAKVQVAKRPSGHASVAQAKVQVAKKALDRKSAAQKQVKVSISRRSLGRTSAVKPRPIVKTPVRNPSTAGSTSSSRHTAARRTPKNASSTIADMTRKRSLQSSSKARGKTASGISKRGSEVHSPPRSAAKPQSPPCSSTVKAVQSSDSHLTSCSTPCSLRSKNTTAGSPSTALKVANMTSSSDSSSGSTPFHTAHSICLSSSSEASDSPTGKRSKMFAGETPYRQKRSSSFKPATVSPVKKASPKKTEVVAAEDVSDGDELNGTFTMVESPILSPKRPSSRLKKLPEPRSSCLRKGASTSRIKKSVSFTVPGRRSVTPKRLPTTPMRSRTLHETLKEWLGARGYSLSALRQSSRDNAVKHETPRKSRRSSGKPLRAALRSSENQALGASPVLQKPAKRSLTQESADDNAVVSKHASVSSLLTDLQQCLDEPNPPEDVETWLDQLEEQVPSVTEYPTYWLCRCLCYEKADNPTEAIRSLVAGLEFVTTGRSELADVLDNLMKRTSEKEPKAAHGSPSPSEKRKSKASTGPRKKRKNLEVVSPENMFDSTIIDYKVYEEPSLKRLSAVMHGKESVAVMTPVRRSSRHSKRRSSVVSPQSLLYKSNPALEAE